VERGSDGEQYDVVRVTVNRFIVEMGVRIVG
jgi:hypothetical protein